MHWELDKTIHTPGMKAPGPMKFVPHARLAKMFKFEQSRHHCQPYRYHIRLGESRQVLVVVVTGS
jgi:hypothetical protein